MILDPAKLLLICVVALMVLGPDKLPVAAKKLSSLVKDLQKMRASVQGEFKKALDDLPMGSELREAKESIGRVTKMSDPRQALYRATGLSASPAESISSDHTSEQIPGSIDISSPESSQSMNETTSVARPFDSRERPTATVGFDPSQN